MEAVTVALGFEHSVVVRDSTFLACCRNVFEFRFKPELILKCIVFVDFVRLDDDDLTAPIRKVEKPFVTELELALHCPVVFIRDKIRLSERCIRLDPQLRRLHHRSEETGRRTLTQCWIRAECREHHACEAFGGKDGGQCFRDLPLHRNDEVFD